MNWRWDQGRLDYFQLKEIENIAIALSAFDGQSLPRGNEPDGLRTLLANFSERPFLPNHYMVWRNYKRVFGCQMLATEVGGILVCTQLCKTIASGSLNGDDYLLHISRHFSYPSPIFDDYDISGSQVWPFCAIIKLLISAFINRSTPKITIDEVIDLIIGNNCDGTESVNFYASLRNTGNTITDENSYRQIRELIRFISQFTFLKWENPYLILDVASQTEAAKIASMMEPKRYERIGNAANELLKIGQGNIEIFPEVQPLESSLNIYDIEFTEGYRSRSLHFKIERSSKLRELYFSRAANPSVCNMCKRDTLDHYPWAFRLIEVHHLLPLSSPLKVEKQSTSLKDVVGLCPTCHRATHRYYSEWLNEHKVVDFKNFDEAMAAYEYTKNNYIR
jgi:hypothetical protein